MKKIIKRFWRLSMMLVLSLTVAGVFNPALNFVVAQDDVSEYACPSNSHVVGDQCYCDDGYYNSGGSCVTAATLCAPYGPSHPVGDDCVCNDGYGVLPGSSKCVSLSAECAKYNAVWSASKGDCVCSSGYHEDSSLNKCVADAPSVPTPKPTVTTTPTVTTPAPAVTAQPTTQPTQTLTTEKLQEELPFAKVDDLMEEIYGKQTPTVQAVIAENQVVVNQEVEKTIVPTVDLYSNLQTSTQPVLFTEPIVQSLDLLSSADKQEAKSQMETLKSFSNSPSEELQLPGEEIVEKIHEASVQKEYTKDLKTWEQQVSEAEKDMKVKAGVDAKKYADDTEMEQRLKAQIATLEKINGFNHLRCLESTKVLKFENMPKDYREYFKGQSAENLFEEAAEGQSFEKAAANVNGTTAQIRALKDELKKNYPAGWKQNYLDIPAKPTVENKRQQMENIFVVFDKLQK
jgi:hypothetical protein